ncbi:MAG: hypothetical protein HS119_09515 [Flavobacteriales bacterium]|jgi:hypothetical protein|nr:hypothetical protein [Flavobacteriales bacterium]
MKITYTTKDESNKVQQAEFLALSPVERLYRFLMLMEKSKWLNHHKEVKKNNFEIVIELGKSGK